jgi:MFS family permease
MTSAAVTTNDIAGGWGVQEHQSWTHCCFSAAGAVSDAVGRKTAFAAATLCTTVFGFATAAAPNYAVSQHGVSSCKAL